MPRFTATTPTRLVAMCAELAAERPGRRVVVIDGADAAAPAALARHVAEHLVTAGRATAVVAMTDFLRPASLRFEYGHTDTESYRTIWFDLDAVRREVVDALHERGRWLPRLWDAARDRSFRDEPRAAAADQILLLAGPMLVGSGLAADATVALQMSEGALRRSTPDDAAWTIPVLVAQAEQAPRADIEVRYDHPERPAVRTD
ncbi:hypothetical protein [Gordonia rhizosphera]|uniref:Uridine kinase n=1 Tax=Gordonia rhizosphera NBRC 16068 TaxID=1108045 RepID=K6WGC9_9ACTN|nr:hypothetical protein [Gordonia rhizosphera]GAB92801.1 hypothetical protein GORHZ_192_00090 [Gordonia rhizosphera NBRC 16068]